MIMSNIFCSDSKTSFNKVVRHRTLKVSLFKQCLSEPEFYGDLANKFRKIVGRHDFSDQFRKIIIRYKRIRYNICYATDCMPGGYPNQGEQLCCPR